VTLTEFLLERFAEDEANADEIDCITTALSGPPYWTPARILAECEAKRRIVEIHYNGSPETDLNRCSPCDTVGADPCPTLRALSLPYADHPDYLPEWNA
jgi:hypothetical protein